MTWFWIALIAPALYAAANHTDKYLISRYFQDRGVGALIIFSAIFSVFALPIVYLINPEVIGITATTALFLIFNGMLVVGSVIFYLYALRQDEASVVIPFYQTIPIFGFILGYFILGEAVKLPQVLGSLLIIFGAFILALQLEEGRRRFRATVVSFMLAASLLYAVNGILFKLFALNLGFWSPVFWMLAGKVLLGIILLLAVRPYRQQFFTVLKSNSSLVLGLNSGNETATILADNVTYYASLLAPVALVLTVNGFQPFFVFVYGVILTWFFPHISRESLKPKLLLQKISAIVLIFIGTLFLAASS